MKNSVLNNNTKNNEANKGDVNMYDINTTFELLNHYSDLIKRERVATVKFEVLKCGTPGNVFVNYQQEGVLLREAKRYEGIEPIVIPDIAGNLASFDKNSEVKFLPEVVKGQFEDMKLLKAALKFGVKLVFKYGEVKVYIPLRSDYTGNFNYYCVNTGKTIIMSRDSKESESLEQDLLTARSISGFNFTPSDIRTKMCMFFDTTDGDNREKILDKLLGGAYSFHKTKNKGLSSVAMVKIGGRTGNINPASTELGYLANEEYGVMFIETPQKSVIKTKVTKENGPTWDGKTEYGAVVMAKFFGDILGMTVNPKACEGLGGQFRLRGFNTKEMGVALGEDNMNHRVEITKKNYAGKYKIVGNPDNIVAIIDDNAAKLVTDLENLPKEGFMLDMLDLAKPSPMRLSIQLLNKIIDMDGVDSVLIAKFKELVKKEMHELFLDAESFMLTPEEAEQMQGYAAQIIGSINRTEARENVSILAGNIRSLAQKFLMLIQKIKIGVSGQNLRIQLDPTEQYLYNPEILEELGIKGILNTGEAFCKGILYEKAEEIKRIQQAYSEATTNEERNVLDQELTELLRGAGIKYPSAGKKEIMNLVFLTNAQIKERINKLPVSDKEKKHILKFFLTLSEGIIILPAVDEIKEQCAGLDTDWDGMGVVWDKDLLDFFFSIDMEIVMIETPDGKSISSSILDEFGFDEDTDFLKDFAKDDSSSVHDITIDNIMLYGYLPQVDNNNLDIGTITNAGQLFDLAAHSPEVAKEVLSRVTDGAVGTEDYLSPFTIESGKLMKLDDLYGKKATVFKVCLDDARIIKNAIMKADIESVANRKLIFRDLNIVTRMLQELTIDSAKKGYTVPVLMHPASHIVAKCMQPLSINTNDFLNSLDDMRRKQSEEFVPFKIRRKTAMNIDGTEKINFDDRFSVVQDTMIKIVEAAFNTVVVDHYLKAKMSDEEKTVLEGAYSSNNVCRDLDETVRSMYTSIVMNRVEESNHFDHDEDSYSEDAIAASERKQAKDEAFERAISILDNTARFALEFVDATPEQKGIMLKAVSISKGYEKGKHKGLDTMKANQFANLIGRDFTLASIVSKPDSIKFCGYNFTSGKKYVEVGQVLSFVDGKAPVTVKNKERFVFINGKFTGDLEVIEYRGRLCAVKPIEVAIKPADMSKMAFKVRQTFDIVAAFKGEFKKTGSYEDFRKYITKASKLMLNPKFTYVEDGKLITVKDAILAEIKGKNGTVKTVLVGRYKCESATWETALNGLEGTYSSDIFCDGETYKSLMIEMDITGRNAQQTNYKAAVDEPVIGDIDSASEEESTDL